MKFQVDEQFLLNCFQEFVAVPSPVAYSEQLLPLLEQYAARFGHTLTYDRRGTAYLTMDGEDNSKTVLLAAHCDTLGLWSVPLILTARSGFVSSAASTTTIWKAKPSPFIPATDGNIPA